MKYCVSINGCRSFTAFLLPDTHARRFRMTRDAGTHGSGAGRHSNHEVTTNHLCRPALLPLNHSLLSFRIPVREEWREGGVRNLHPSLENETARPCFPLIHSHLSSRIPVHVEFWVGRGEGSHDRKALYNLRIELPPSRASLVPS